MPFRPTGQVFCLECNVVVFAPKLVDRIFSGPRENWKILSNEKKNSWKICTRIPLVPIVQEFRPKCNVTIFAQKREDSIFRGLRNKLKILQKTNKKELKKQISKNLYENAPLKNK